ncbi:acyltransferase family protein [Bradyrhizobium sp. WSM 1791]|uniref:Acyltransferase family protein n=2 Tax=Bradyrhizobium australiense TaxID=2721161 RepID=A0A7Y4LYW4_9BRAD|nr:acyltransferase family protein [Bradyrhizobium australiense]
MPSRPLSLEGIQVLRAIAGIIVVLHHSLEESIAAIVPFSPDWFTTFGAAGVDIFFVISGFIMLYVNFPGASVSCFISSLSEGLLRPFAVSWGAGQLSLRLPHEGPRPTAPS